MQRRKFIKLSGLAAVPLVLESCKSGYTGKPLDYEIQVESLHTIGHKLTSGFNFSRYPTEKLATDYLIVGGGIAGFSALTKLKGKDRLLVEAGSKPGGTSSYATYKEIIFSQGAHYDVEYPNFYGKEVLKHLEDLRIIQFDSILNKWEFVEKEYLIPQEKESITYFENKIVEDPLNISEKEKEFSALMSRYYGKLPLPTRMIPEDLHGLNQVNFKTFLEQKGLSDELLFQALDYQFIDDYGEGMNGISALAGIHYFACRPYFNQNPMIFSPPEGNYYFVRKMLQHNHDQEILLNSFVYRILKTKEGFETSIWDEKENKIRIVRSKKVIYTGKKHALKFIYPELSFEHPVEYAPWMVINFILPNFGLSLSKNIWQNDVVGERGFMGFVDSRAQFDVDAPYRSLTAYYCLKKEERGQLLDIFKNPRAIVENTKKIIERYQGIQMNQIYQVQLKLMGHAMPIPKPGYLLQDMNDRSSDPDFIFSGVDNHRLPLLLDAMDSGLHFQE
ncbi:MAG: FAD/NAD(P)-binding protein [Crocinitomicaceae bacterium]